MSLFIASLNSGSNGNCYYVGNGREAILVDAGISCRETERRMARLGLPMSTVKAIFVSHEHTDHIAGLPVLARKYKLPVYLTQAMIPHSGLDAAVHHIELFRSDDLVEIGDLQVKCFSKLHDACDPHSFTVSGGEITVGVFTDLGRCCNNLVAHFRQCHAAFLEANYDVEMLNSGRYPYFLKKRISGGHGHLSNDEALNLFLTHKPAFMSHLLLAHLSKDNNCPELVQKLFGSRAGATRVAVASRYHESEVHHITGEMPLADASFEAPVAVQMSLF